MSSYSNSSYQSSPPKIVLTDEGFHIPFFINSEGVVRTKAAENIPMLRWPNGAWCFEANGYMLKLYDQNLSRINRGGTLSTYASNITHLLRFCFDRKLRLDEITDMLFAEFIVSLSPNEHREWIYKRKPINQARVHRPQLIPRDTNTICAIGRSCLDLLDHVSQGLSFSLVGENGAVRGFRKRIELRVEGKMKPLVRYVWHHSSFPTRDPKKVRSPITSKAIEALRYAATDLSGDKIYIRKRRYAMLRLLEMTGCRRGEIARITCSAVTRAYHSEEPMLEVPTLKKKRPETRLIPVSKTDISFIKEYISKNRDPLARKRRTIHTHDLLLLNFDTGLPLREDSISDEIALLSKHSGIKERACAHMFRHRYITKIFVQLVERYKIASKDDFRREIIEAESIRAKVMEWTGQKSVASFEGYLDLAFAELARFKRADHAVRITLALDGLKRGLDEVKLDIRSKADPSLILRTLERLVEQAKDALEAEQNLTVSEDGEAELA